jgi:hypothetical protein
MKEIINLKSRGNNKNYLRLLKKLDGSESKTYLLKTKGHTIRNGYLEEDSRFYIEPPGGKAIIVGNILPEAELVVKSIDFVFGKGFAITFE